MQSLTELTLLSGKDLGLAFDIPPHIRNQALFAACVLKVTGILQISKMIIIFLGLLMGYLSIKFAQPPVVVHVKSVFFGLPVFTTEVITCVNFEYHLS